MLTNQLQQDQFKTNVKTTFQLPKDFIRINSRLIQGHLKEYFKELFKDFFLTAIRLRILQENFETNYAN